MVGGIFNCFCFFLVFLSNVGPNFPNVAFGVFRPIGGFLPTSAEPFITPCAVCFSLSSVNFASQPIIMETCKECRVEWESVVVFVMNENVGEERGEKEERAEGRWWWGLTCLVVLCCAVLCCAVLCCAVLCCAVLCCAVLCCAVLCCATNFCQGCVHSPYSFCSFVFATRGWGRIGTSRRW